MSLPMPIRQQLLQLLQSVSRATGVPTASLLGRSRHAKVTQARSIFAFLATRLGISTAQTGEFLRRDRSAIQHAIRTIEAELLLNPDAHPISLIPHLLQDHIPTPPVHQIHPHLHQPTKLMTLRRPPKSHRLDVAHVADAARKFQAALSAFAADERTTELEALVFLRETAAHCMAHYTAIRTSRRIACLEADPYNEDRGLESWIDLAETAAEVRPPTAPTRRATHARPPPPSHDHRSILCRPRRSLPHPRLNHRPR